MFRLRAVVLMAQGVKAIKIGAPRRPWKGRGAPGEKIFSSQRCLVRVGGFAPLLLDTHHAAGAVEIFLEQAAQTTGEGAAFF